MLISLGIGTVLGFLSGLGIGGGSLLILWLTLITGMEQSEARTVNLLFFLPAAVVACYYRRKQGTLDFRKIVPAIVAGCMGAVLGTTLGRNLEASLLQKGFGILLLATGLREILWKPKKKAP
jgi:uncharacterized membrane protein YfcA